MTINRAITINDPSKEINAFLTCDRIQPYYEVIYPYLEHISKNYVFIKSKPLEQNVQKINSCLLHLKRPTSEEYLQNIYNIATKSPSFLNIYFTFLEKLQNNSTLLDFHLKNMNEVCDLGEPEFLQSYFLSLQTLLNNSTLLDFHLKNMNEVCDLGRPEVLKTYLMSLKDLQNNPTLLDFHIRNIRVLINSQELGDYLQNYLVIMQSINQNNLLEMHIRTTANIYSSHQSILSLYLENLCLIQKKYPQHLNSYFEVIAKTVIPSSTQDAKTWLYRRMQEISKLNNPNDFLILLELMPKVNIVLEGKAFLIEEIVKNMKEEDKEHFVSISTEIMPYVIEKTIFLYAFNLSYISLDPAFFNSKAKEKIGEIQKKMITSDTLKHIEAIFTSLAEFNNYLNEEAQENNTRALFKEIHKSWSSAIQGENNLFMLSWQAAISHLS